MSEAPFFKLSGAGNDFVALVEPPAEPGEAQVRAWCRRGLSLGADGVFTLERRRDGARMRHYNADGSRADLCLNGSRCAARLALHLGWGDGEVELVTDAGVLRARRTGDDRVAVELPDIVGWPEARSLEWSGQRHDGFYLRVGVPHFVLPWPGSLRDAPVAELGPPLRRHADLGADGANVNFVRFVAPDRCEIRTFERGVEAETLACGTGVVATVAAGTAAGRLGLSASVLTLGGYELSVRGGGEGPLVLEGDARILASGGLLAGADAVPTAPRWS